MRKIAQHKGQGLVEYLLLTCLIAATAIGVLSVFGQNIKEQFRKASATIRGEDATSIPFTQPTEEQAKGRGMSDWERGSTKVQ